MEGPEDDADGNGDVERVFGAVLGNFDGKVGGVDDFLGDAGDFVAEDESIFHSWVWNKTVKADGGDSLLYADNDIAFRAEFPDGIHGIIKMFPGDT